MPPNTRRILAKNARPPPIWQEAVAAAMRHRTLVVASLPRPATEDDDGRWVEKARHPDHMWWRVKRLIVEEPEGWCSQ